MLLNETLELKTTANLLEKRIILKLNFMTELDHSSDKNYAFYFKNIDVSLNKWVFAIEECMDNYWTTFIPMEGVPRDRIKVWQITRRSDGLIIVCNGVTVVNFNFQSDYRDGYDSCQEIWGQSSETTFYFPRWGTYGDSSQLLMRIGKLKKQKTPVEAL